MNAELRNNPANYRYEIWVDGELAGYTQYGLGRGRIAYLHTVVYEPYEVRPYWVFRNSRPAA